LTVVDANIELPAAYVLIEVGEVDDLRDTARKLADQGAEEGTILFAMSQRKPKGIGGKAWNAYPDNLHASIILEPEIPADQYHQMLYVAMVSLGNAVAAHVAPMTSLGYGWPNDLRIAGNKIGSVWLDVGTRESGPWLCITCSVNVRHGPEDFSVPAMSILEAEGSSALTAADLLQTWAKQFITEINAWAERGFSHTLAAWRVRAEFASQEATTELQGRTIKGQYKSITDQGQMVVQGADGVTSILSVKEYMGWNG